MKKNINKRGILKRLDIWIKKLGSLRAVANKIGVNPAVISQIRNGKYDVEGDDMWIKIAVGLDYKDYDWNIVSDVANYKKVELIVKDAKENSFWMSISNKAGSGKTGALKDIFEKDETGSIVYILCEEWSAQQFLMNIINQTIGAKALKNKSKTASDLIKIIADYFNKKQFEKPILLLDECDKLRPTGLRTLIYLFNKTEDRLGLVMSGSDNLQKEIEKGVRLCKKGYDEIASRIGRCFISLKGFNKSDFSKICSANGIDDIQLQEHIWNNEFTDSEKIKGQDIVVKNGKLVTINNVEFIVDLRRVKRIIKTHLIIEKRKQAIC